MNQIILNGISVPDLLAELRAIVKEEVSTMAISSQPPASKRFLNAKEAADFLGISLQTLYQNIDKIPCRKKHSKLHFIESELAAYLEGGLRK